jgi:hypothetical protein
VNDVRALVFLSGLALDEGESCAGVMDPFAIPPERTMAKRMNATTDSVDGSHVAFISHPDVAAGLILKALSSI